MADHRDFFGRKNGKPYATDERNAVLKLMLNKVLGETYRDCSIGTVTTCNPTIEFGEEVMDEVIERFDKTWTTFYNEYKNYRGND